MDQLSVNTPPTSSKATRRQYTPEFRAKIVALAEQPQTSVAAVAQAHQLNANLVHKWRRAAKKPVAADSGDSPAFLSLPATASPSAALGGGTVRLEIRGLTIDWPLSAIDRAIPWLKALGL
ncbi:IS66-like element accessory protein TnpA [Marinobacter shengliensis]